MAEYKRMTEYSAAMVCLRLKAITERDIKPHVNEVERYIDHLTAELQRRVDAVESGPDFQYL